MSGRFAFAPSRHRSPAEPASPYVHWWLTAWAPSQPTGGDPCLVALTGSGAGDLWARIVPTCRDAAAPAPSCRPDLSRTLGQGQRAARSLRRQMLGPSRILGQDVALTPIDLSPDALNRAQAEHAGWQPGEPLAVAAPRAVLAIIDDGIAFANERFRLADGGPRFDYVWLQDAACVTDAAAKAGAAGRSGDLPFGRELIGADIAALLARAPDEMALYRAAGLIDPRRATPQSALCHASHGTAVADRAAGADPEAAPRDLALMGVCLPGAITHDTSGTFLDAFVILAIRRILARVDWLETRTGKPLPVVINFSYALTAGSKDGQGPLDRFLGAVTEERRRSGRTAPVHFVVPAGNHRQERTRARLGPNGTVIWRLPPDDRTASFLEIWLKSAPRRPEGGRPSVLVRLAPPGAAGALALVESFGRFADLEGRAGPIARVYHSWHPADPAAPRGVGRERIVVVIPPNVLDAGSPADFRGLPGDWQVGIEMRPGAPDPGASFEADLFIQRDDTPFGNRQRGRQSYFLHEGYARFAPGGRALDTDDGSGAVTRHGTINAIGSAGRARVIGGARQSDQGSMGYSGMASGPNQPLHAIADLSAIHRGVLVAGTFSGSAATVSGTSMAAPRYAGALAARLAQAPDAPPDLPERATPAGFALLDDAEPQRHARPISGRLAPDRREREPAALPPSTATELPPRAEFLLL